MAELFVEKKWRLTYCNFLNCKLRHGYFSPNFTNFHNTTVFKTIFKNTFCEWLNHHAHYLYLLYLKTVRCAYLHFEDSGKDCCYRNITENKENDNPLKQSFPNLTWTGVGRKLYIRFWKSTTIYPKITHSPHSDWKCKTL